VEPLPSEIANAPSHTADIDRRVRTSPSPSAATPAARAGRGRRDHSRLGLQRRASGNLRRHLLRAVRRITALLLADLASFYVMRALVRAVRDDAVLGDWVAGRLNALMPAGILNGWQFAAALLVALFVTGTYAPGDHRRNPRRLFLACALATALPLWMTIWTRGLDIVALQYALTTVLVWTGIVAERLTIDRLVARVVPASQQAAHTLFVGLAEECREAMSGSAFARGNEFFPIGFVDTRTPPAPEARGHISEFPAVLHDSRAEAVVVCGYLTDVRFRDVVDVALAAGCQVLSVPRVTELAGVQPTLIWRRDQALMQLTAPSLRGWQLAVKRVIDLFAAAVGLVVLSPLFGLLAVLVKLDSPGPVFFRQERVGRGGRPFRINKFRTMQAGAEDRRDELLGKSIYKDARLFKVPSDPRVTRLGRWLRRTSLDELPQLMNVLRGEMSLVGPRPPIPSEVELYEAHHYARFDVKPGITGPWQVAGRNQITDFEKIIALETHYIREWSLLSDIAILLRTVWVVVQMQGAH